MCTVKKTLRATRLLQLSGEARFVKGRDAEWRDNVDGFSRPMTLPRPTRHSPGEGRCHRGSPRSAHCLDTRGHSTARWHVSGVLAPLNMRGA